MLNSVYYTVYSLMNDFFLNMLWRRFRTKILNACDFNYPWRIVQRKNGSFAVIELID